MRPLKLSLSGFMSFRERQTVAMDDLSLFAITGPTGSGKSSLLDAIVYALYGQTPRLGKQRLESLIHQNADSLQVSLEFASRDVVYRVFRTLQHSKGSNRSQVRLERQEGTDWKQLPETSSSDIARRVQAIVGLDYDNFTRAVLLPQGDFSAFLQGTPSQRGDLLIKLLGLERLKDMQRHAGDIAKAAKQRSSYIDEEIGRNYQGVSIAALQAKQQEKTALEQQLQSLQQDVHSLRQRLAAESQLKDLLSDWRQAAEHYTALQSQAEAKEAEQQRLQAAQAAAPLMVLLAERQQAQQQLEQAQQQQQQQQQALQAKSQQLAQAQQALEHIRQQRQTRLPQLEAQLLSLSALQGDMQQLRALGGDLSLAEQADNTDEAVRYSPEAWQTWQQQQQAQQQFAYAAQALEQAQQRQQRESQDAEKQSRQQRQNLDKRQQQQRKQLEQQANKAHAKQQQLEQTLQQRQQEQQQLQRELEASTQRGSQARQAEQAAKAAYEQARQRDLVATLLHESHSQTGDPCPVCGAVLEQLPITFSDDAHLDAQDADVRTLETRYQQAQAELQEAIDAYRDLQQRQQLSSERCHDLQQQLQQAQQESQDAQQALQQFQDQAAQERAALDQELQAQLQALATRHSAEQNSLETTLQQARASCGVDAQTSPAQVAAQLEKQRQVLLASFAHSIRSRSQGLDPEHAPQALRLERQELEQQLQRCQDAYQHQQDAHYQLRQDVAVHAATLEQQHERLEQQQQRWQEALANSTFRDETQLQAAYMSADKQQQLEQTLHNYQQALRDAEQHYATLEAKRAGRDLDLEAYAQRQHQASELEAKRDAALLQQGQLQRSTEELRGKISDLIEREKEKEQLAERFDTYRQLNLDLQGNKFQTYLLTRVQEQLAHRASHMLANTSQGRYDLRLVDNEFYVSDAWHTGELRRAKTLSGGETFMASLALALALSETIADNTVLGALFLDEGFGTLDSEALDAVATALESLTHQGRMVGIISHVTALSARVPERLRITPGPQGSQAAWDV